MGEDFIEQGRGPEGADGGALGLRFRHRFEQAVRRLEFQVVEVLEGGAEFFFALERDSGSGSGAYFGDRGLRGRLRDLGGRGRKNRQRNRNEQG